MRYSRQEIFPKIGTTGQKKLATSTVTIVGVGALGSVAAELCTRAGVGTLILIDRDSVELSNLQRQSLYTEADVGTPKAAIAKERLEKINSEITIEAHCTDLNHLTLNLLQGLVLDCTDNLKTRFLINEWCVKNKQHWIHAAVLGQHGRVFAYVPGKTCYRCFTGEAQQQETCETAGVLNTAVHMVASLQITQAFKILLGADADSQLVTIDIWNGSLQKVNVKKNPKCPTCLGKYEFLEGKAHKQALKFCGSGNYQLTGPALNLDTIRERWDALGEYEDRGYALSMDGIHVFSDGRVLIKAETEPEARALYSKYIGD